MSNMTGVFLSIEIMQDSNLSLQEKVILSLVKNMGQLYMSNHSLSQLLGVSKSRVSHLITSLKSKGYVDVALIYNEDRQVDKRIVTIKKAIEKVQEVVQSIKDKVTGGKNKTIKQEQAYTTTTKTVGTEKVQQVTFGNKYYNKKTWQDNICSHNWDLDELEMLAMRRTERDVEEYRRENTND